MHPCSFLLRLRVKSEIEAGLCNKKALVQEASHSITAKRSWRSIQLDKRFFSGENGKEGRNNGSEGEVEIRVKPEIEADLSNKKALVKETSHSITAKRSWRSIQLDERFVPGENGKKKGAITGEGWREEGREQNEKRMRNCHPGRGSVSATNGFMGGFPGSSLLL
ncbi:hypothetical protein CEXT_741171 [Caerostris extrusa]|uniref:Uncharacterized protein n=1 Tax=Caerostris extrusa TaxID=172846 RepID=A0AAV4SQL0_CAEEX|nr:hypothetical protein CEXT_741171 [Caerostris extrusa]